MATTQDEMWLRVGEVAEPCLQLKNSSSKSLEGNNFLLQGLGQVIVLFVHCYLLFLMECCYLLGSNSIHTFAVGLLHISDTSPMQAVYRPATIGL